jgi:predicted RecA/RadA family phage recombinase
MAGITNNYDLRFPQASDAVNVHTDIKKLADDVDDAISSLDASNVRIKVINKTTSDILGGSPVYASTFNNIGQFNNKTVIAPFTSNLSDNYPLLGLTKGTIAANGGTGEVVTSGVLTYPELNTSSYDAGDVLYVDETGSLTTNVTGGAVGIVAVASNTDGVIVIQAKGNGTWGALKAGLA